MRPLRLTPREKATARCILEGYSEACTASQIGVNHETVKFFTHHLYDKTGQDNRVGLVMFLLHNPWALSQVMEVMDK